MAMPLPKARYTVDDLDAMPDDGNRYEIVHGALFVTPSPRVWHQAALFELALRLYPYISALGFRLLIAPTSVRASGETNVEPDLFVYPRRADVDGSTRWVAMNRLMLAVEILSRTTAHVDRGAKRDVYRDEGIAEYWIVDVDAQTISVYTPVASGPRVLSDQLCWAPVQAQDPFVLDIIDYFRVVRS